MIAKLIVHGPDRPTALARLAAALAGTEVAGTVTNIAFLGALARHPGFASGDVDTGLIARDLEALTGIDPAPGPALALAALGAAGLAEGGGPGTGFALWAPLRRRVAVAEAGQPPVEAVIEALAPGHFVVEVAGARHDCRRDGAGWWVDGARAPRLRADAAGVHLFGPVPRHFLLADPLTRGAAAAAGAALVTAPMPGLVRRVFVAVGDAVAPGDRLAVFEAMKMEHTLTAAAAGRVAELLVAEGAQVEAGAPLIRLEEPEPEG